MDERIRFKCPCCGMVSGIERLDRSYKIKVWIQEFGGKVAGEFKGRGKAKGYMKYTDVTKLRRDIVMKIKERLNRLGEE